MSEAAILGGERRRGPSDNQRGGGRGSGLKESRGPGGS